ncbi:MAG: EAL domain-containing protein, partial [Pseudomonadales bacterium]
HDYLTIDEGERFLFAVSREVEALHNAQHAQSSASVLAEAEAKSQLLLSTTADAIAYVADGMLIDANTVFVETLGYSDVDDLELMPLMDLVAENSQGEMRKVIKLLSKGDSDIPSTDTYLQNASGESVQVSIDFSAASHEGEACTQIILRGLHGNDISANSPASAPNPSQAGAANVTASASSPAVALRDISALQQIGGKGMVYFVSLSNVAGFRRNIDLVNYAKLIDSIDEKLRSLLPANAFVSCYSGEHWVIATPDNDEVENHLGKEICQLIDQTINNASEADNGNFAAIGISKYGVADMSASDAIEKAFNVCATQLASGGFKLFSPRIDNAQGSAALKSAMELDRLKIKYQPVIGLHNQSTQWYDAFVFMRNDAGVEQDASELLESLGIEKDNVALDQWLVTQSIEALSSLVYENPHISLSVPLTASAISDEHFVGWLMDTVQASGLPKDSISFNVSAEQAQNYEAKCRKLFVTLLENGFKTTIKGVATEQVDIVKACKPDFVQLDAALTENLNAEENNSKEGLKTIISQSSDTGAVCIAVAVNTAADLAQLWQTGIPYVQGSYLQAPLPAMSYEFSDIA